MIKNLCDQALIRTSRLNADETLAALLDTAENHGDIVEAQKGLIHGLDGSPPAPSRIPKAIADDDVYNAWVKLDRWFNQPVTEQSDQLRLLHRNLGVMKFDLITPIDLTDGVLTVAAVKPLPPNALILRLNRQRREWICQAMAQALNQPVSNISFSTEEFCDDTPPPPHP